MVIATECRGLPCKLPQIAARGNCRGCYRVMRKLPCGWPRNSVGFRGNCSGWTSVEIAVVIARECRGNCRVLPWHLPWEDCRGNCRGMPWHSPLIAVECRGNWRGDGHGICRGSCRGTSISCHGWYHGGCHGQNRGTCHGHNHGTCRGSTMYNRKPWPLPWKPADIHGSPWQDPRKTTEVPRSLPRTPTEKLNNVHLCPVVYGDKKNRYTLYLVYR